MKLKQKTAVITGGAGSLGLATARLFLREGARVVLVDLAAAALDQARQALPDGDVLFVQADVGSEEGARSYVEAAVAAFGPIDIFFSNAGNFGEVRPIADYSLEVFEAVQRVHVSGAFLAAKHATPRMRDGGSFIITSSVAATRGDPGVYAYITAKHAQTGLMRCLAKELAPRRIRVNTLHPGPLENGFQHAVEAGISRELGIDGTAMFNSMIPLGRHGLPEEVARSVLYLASDDSSFTTGSMLMVDGGMSV
ncbi:SDR family oxidoreductase [Microvirga tunisiensis]|uniref:SDR family oxidoreductase n=2 Tax=Pannonibacter tanglangensis TaxID=2750084 RepID=A0ABW9ZGB1_9HYPH|nr:MULTISPECIES: SDR family NAD(P)-dependent oxidoreductase [unclassified Pannonibacter]NBN63893.1 SDR family oxidoreductase [Pannonibacter sp. XCT-34]NBN77532.1 SDR family oxidoreductase [Pannonibacter sp. XCT-53]